MGSSILKNDLFVDFTYKKQYLYVLKCYIIFLGPVHVSLLNILNH